MLQRVRGVKHLFLTQLFQGQRAPINTKIHTLSSLNNGTLSMRRRIIMSTFFQNQSVNSSIFGWEPPSRYIQWPYPFPQTTIHCFPITTTTATRMMMTSKGKALFSRTTCPQFAIVSFIKNSTQHHHVSGSSWWWSSDSSSFTAGAAAVEGTHECCKRRRLSWLSI